MLWLLVGFAVYAGVCGYVGYCCGRLLWLVDCAGVFGVLFVRLLSGFVTSCWYLVASELFALFVLVGFILYYAVIRV